jgi:hypothetical protein
VTPYLDFPWQSTQVEPWTGLGYSPKLPKLAQSVQLHDRIHSRRANRGYPQPRRLRQMTWRDVGTSVLQVCVPGKPWPTALGVGVRPMNAESIGRLIALGWKNKSKEKIAGAQNRHAPSQLYHIQK